MRKLTDDWDLPEETYVIGTLDGRRRNGRKWQKSGWERSQHPTAILKGVLKRAARSKPSVSLPPAPTGDD